MDLVGNLEFLDQAIGIQRAALRSYLGLAVTVLGLGVGIMLLIHLTPVVPENLKWQYTLGGGFFSTLSTFPLKEIFSRKDKIAALIFLRQRFETLQARPAAADAQELNLLQQRFWQFVDKILGG